MLQRAFNKLKKKKTKRKKQPFPCFIPVGKALPRQWECSSSVAKGERGKKRISKLNYCSPFICMKLFTTFSCCSRFFPTRVSAALSFIITLFGVGIFQHRWHCQIRCDKNWSSVRVCVCVCVLHDYIQVIV